MQNPKEAVKNDLMTKIVLSTIKNYLDASKDEGIEPTGGASFLARLSGSLSLYVRNYTFYPNEIKYLESVSDEDLKKMIATPVSYLLFVLELSKLWVLDYPKDKRPILNISDKKMKIGKAALFREMLELKKAEEKIDGETEKYGETKQIIDESIDLAKIWYDWHNKRFRGVTEETLVFGEVEWYKSEDVIKYDKMPCRASKAS